MENYILDIQRMSTEDGPGIRTTVFFKGCNLKCRWCHNPESIAFNREKYWMPDNCMFCLSCQEACPEQAIYFDEQGMNIDDKLCAFCLTCADVCPSNAIEVKGKKIDIDELVYELEKDSSFYKHSQGGITLSGGEALLQSDYLLELVKKLKEKSIHLALDTAGHYPFEKLEKLLPYIDLILYDLKIFNDEEHKKYTGVTNKLILENAIKLGKIETPEIWIRTPIIPGATDSNENIEALGQFINSNLPRVSKWELLSFNNLSKEKYRYLGLNWDYTQTELISKDKMIKLCQTAQRYISNATWSGATKLEV